VRHEAFLVAGADLTIHTEPEGPHLRPSADQHGARPGVPGNMTAMRPACVPASGQGAQAMMWTRSNRKVRLEGQRGSRRHAWWNAMTFGLLDWASSPPIGVSIQLWKDVAQTSVENLRTLSLVLMGMHPRRSSHPHFGLKGVKQ
jgi:hypothetical protein